MERTPVVTCFLRHEGAVLLLYRSEGVGSYQGTWGAVAGHAEGDPDAAARQEIREETGLDPEADLTFVRRGDSFEVPDEDQGRRWVVHPYLFDCATRAVETNWESDASEWVAPTAIRHRETVPDLWTSYDRVRPSVDTVAEESEHGAAYISVRALEVLRDEAAIAADADDDWESLADLALALREARPSMPVVRNRINRVMHAASDDHGPRAVEQAASAGIQAALHADERAARRAAERIGDARVATLSRSGTVTTALSLADTEAVLVAESRPGREGLAVAAELADEMDVTVTTDAAFAYVVDEWGADAVLVGADAVRTDGAVVNKAGTRTAALSGTCEGIEVLVAAAIDKVAPEDRTDLEPRESDEVYESDADVRVRNPTFDVTPAECVDAVVTESGVLDAEEVADVVAAHRERADWPSE
jgi:translation initiation factor 2B subunit (eIF-2B alpha/beta/delta family)